MKKKILVLTGDANTLIFHRGELLKSFAASGLEVVAAASQEAPEVEEYLESIGGHYRQVDLARTSLNPIRDVRTVRDIARLIKDEQPDYIFSYAIKSVIYGSVLAKLCGVPKIYALVPGLGYAFTPDGTWKQRYVCWASTLLYSIALRCVDKVFLQNHDDERLLRNRHILPRRVPSHVTLGSGVKLDQFEYRSLANDEDVKESNLRFVLVSRLLRKKGIAEYAQAARKLKSRYPKLEFQLIGPLDSSPDGIPEEEVRFWNDTGVINYKGSTKDVAAALRQAHVFVLPTYYREGVPRSILEALATGMPVVTTNAVGSRETIVLSSEGIEQMAQNQLFMEGENGLLIQPHSVEAIVEAMEWLLKHPSQVVDMAAQGRKLAEERFDVRRVNAAILREMGLKAVFKEIEPEAEGQRKAA